MRRLKIFITGAAVLLLVVVGIGLALDGTWQVERSRVVAFPPAAVFAEVNSVEGWATWGSFAIVGAERSGPASGPGATMRWNDAEWGRGEWALTDAEADRSVRYEARVEGGSIVTRGHITLAPAPGGTRIDWVESGDFGWNPVLGFMALAMDRLQGTEMEKTLDRLEQHLGGRASVGDTAPHR